MGRIVVEQSRGMHFNCRREVQARMSEGLLRDIAEYCRGARMAESTFGRLAVNDGKLVNRLRLGGRVTTETVDRVHAFINAREAGHPANGSPAPALSPKLITPPPE